MGRTFYRVDAFTDRLFGGNTACVVPDARGLSDDAMRAIAREMNCGATAFVLPKTRADCTHRVRFWKPQGDELPTCGHATIATFAVLTVRGETELAAVMECGAGAIPIGVELGANGVRVAMGQGAGKIEPIASSAGDAALADALGIAGDAIAGAGSLATTGGAWIALAELRDVDAVRACAPAVDRVAALGATRIYPFARVTDTTGRSRAHARYFFANANRMEEDPVTGTAAGALAAWLHHRRALETGAPLVVEQGIECHRPGLIEATVDAENRVTIRGNAVLVFEATLPS